MSKKTPETNPFVQALEINSVWKLEIEEINVGESAGGKITQAKTKIIDVDDRVSVYSAGLLGWFKDLPASAKDMFMYIGAHLGWERDIIEMDEEKYCKMMDVSRNTFFSAKTALTNRLIIPRTSRKNTYWVNPAYLFKGNRVTSYPERVVETNTNPLDNLRSTPVTKSGYRSIME